MFFLSLFTSFELWTIAPLFFNRKNYFNFHTSTPFFSSPIVTTERNRYIPTDDNKSTYFFRPRIDLRWKLIYSILSPARNIQFDSDLLQYKPQARSKLPFIAYGASFHSHKKIWTFDSKFSAFNRHSLPESRNLTRIQFTIEEWVQRHFEMRLHRTGAGDGWWCLALQWPMWVFLDTLSLKNSLKFI